MHVASNRVELQYADDDPRIDRAPRSGDYERLEREAARLGMRPGTLARVLLRASLGQPEPRSENRQVSFQHLLDRLAALCEGLTPADAAAIVAAGRAELDRRGEPGHP